MPLRISSGDVSASAGRYAAQAQDQVERSLTALAAGSRLTKASDDAAGFAIAESLRGQIAGTNQARSNAQGAQGLIQTAEGGLSEQNNILVRLRELAVNAATDTVGDDERGYLNTEFQQLSKEFDRIAKSTRFGKQQLLTGDGTEYSFQVGPFKGEENTINFKLDANTTASRVGVSGLDVTDKGSALDALDTLDDAIQRVAGTRASFGAVQSRLTHASDALSVQAENLESAHSRIADVDVAEETSKLAQAQMKQQSSISVLAQANQSRGRALRLLE